ncbi:DUF4339 domain-containing protein [Bradyrhizobium ottawaense]|uniref:DUF4339 domain-containing protein n=1 Tax=Bradyrhizobium ottawaense TaxID=931866 RepID=UPI0035162673
MRCWRATCGTGSYSRITPLARSCDTKVAILHLMISEEAIVTTAWWLSDGTGKVGPLSLSELAETVSTYPLERIDDVLVWREGFSEWRPVNEVTELSAHALHDFKGANQGAYSTDHNANCCIDTANLDERHLMRRPAVSTKTIPLAVAATVAALVLVAWVWWPPAETNGSISVANHGGGTGLTLLANGLLEKQARRDAQLRGPWPDAYDRRGYKTWDDDY